MPTKHGSLLEREDFDDVTVVHLKIPKPLHEDAIRAAFESIYSLVSDVGRSKLVLNLAAVEYLPSMGLGKLVMLNRKIQAANGRLVLCELTPTVVEILESIPVFNVCATEQEAVQSCA